MNKFDEFQHRTASAANVFFWWYILPALFLAFLLLATCSQDFRESVFGPDYYTRSTPAYHGQLSRWDRLSPTNW